MNLKKVKEGIMRQLQKMDGGGENDIITLKYQNVKKEAKRYILSTPKIDFLIFINLYVIYYVCNLCHEVI